MESNLNKYTYPDYFVPHPDIQHQKMMQKIWPHIEPNQLSFTMYMKYYQSTYIVLCENFEEYEKYLEDEFWNEFRLNSMKKRTKIITI